MESEGLVAALFKFDRLRRQQLQWHITPSAGQSNEMCSYKISNESQPMVQFDELYVENK